MVSKLLIVAIPMVVTSCGKVKEKAGDATRNVRDASKEQLAKVVDKIFPPFDADQPDTGNNKLRFKDFLKVELTSDITNIYCFDSALGFDASYMFAFSCSPETSKKIISENNLAIDLINTDNGFLMQNDFDWWDKERIAKLKKYSWTDEDRYYKYYWYDKEYRKAYYFEFDM